MSQSKVKKHFSLFMVKKSIKRSAKNSSKVPYSKTQVEAYTIIPKFIDPYYCFHLKGDMFFIDKPYEKEIGLMSPRNNYRPVEKMSFIQSYNMWGTHFVSTNFKFDSWGIVYERLMTLGDSNAYELAKVIHSQFLSHGDLCKPIEPEYILPIETSKNFQDFSLEIDQILTNKKDAYYMMVQYEVESPEKGLVMKQMGFSKVLVDLLWGDNSTFLEL